LFPKSAAPSVEVHCGVSGEGAAICAIQASEAAYEFCSIRIHGGELGEAAPLLHFLPKFFEPAIDFYFFEFLFDVAGFALIAGFAFDQDFFAANFLFERIEIQVIHRRRRMEGSSHRWSICLFLAGHEVNRQNTNDPSTSSRVGGLAVHPKIEKGFGKTISKFAHQGFSA
jgi:hypothetical protein